jgi:fermentation-respiration switch protein FrsA (DUF1100 family)
VRACGRNPQDKEESVDRKRKTATAVLLAVLLMAPYPWVINSCSFHPDRVYVPEADQLPPGVEELFIPTDDGQRLQCYWLPRPSSGRVLIYFNGNSGNLAHRLTDLMRLAEMDINVLGAGYRGFGKSTGRPSERGIYKDGRAALDHVMRRGFKMEQIILLGYSLGTTVVVDIAQGQALGGLVLVTPLTSGKAVAQVRGYGPFAWFAGNKFNALSKIDRLRSPMLIVHGTADEVIPLSMGEQIFAAAREPKKMVVIDGAHHSDISFFAPELYLGAIRDFIDGLDP